MCNLVADRNQRFRFQSSHREVHEIFCTCLRLQSPDVYRQFFLGLRSHVQRYFSTTYHLVVFFHLIRNLVFLQVGEIETVEHIEFSIRQVCSLKSHILVRIFHFTHRRMRITVRIHDTVAAEVTVARHIGTEVTSVSPIVSAVLILYQDTLVYPVPDITSLEVRIAVNRFPLVPQASGRVTHGMRIFRRHHRTVTTPTADAFQPRCTRILGYVHI